MNPPPLSREVGVGKPKNFALTYYNGSTYTFTWKDGRRLVTATKDGVSYSFTYNDEGIRTSKTVEGVKHTYVLDGSRIVSEQWDNKLMLFSYDESGAPIAIHYRLNGSAEDVFYTYYLEKNLQGDIIALYNSSGTKLVGYTYDAWGNCTTTYYNNGGSTGAQFNPFRYRGYYYDSDLGLYYLNSRYYDANTGRFINADGQLNDGLLGYNQFAYCENNPISNIDPMGTWGWKSVALILVGVAVAAAAATFVACTAGVGLGILGVSMTTVSAAVKAGIIAGTVYGTLEIANQLIESNGEELDISSVLNTSLEESFDAVGNKIFQYFDTIKTGVEITASHTKDLVIEHQRGNSVSEVIKDYGSEMFNEVIIPLFCDMVRSKNKE